MATPREVDGDALRDIMRRVPSPVTVVTVGGESPRGITIGSFTSTSLDPPLVTFNVGHDAQAHEVLVTSDRFAVHVLSDRQAWLSDHFAAPDRSSEEQFGPISYLDDEHGTPLLDGVVAVLHCRLHATYEAGDHTLVVGEVVEIQNGEEERPLLYFDRGYHELGPLLDPSTVKRGSSGTS